MSLDRAAEESKVLGLAGRVGRGLTTCLEPATRRLAALGRQLVWLIRSSRLYGWLTAKPYTDPVMIDLRKTYIVGPVLAILDWLAAIGADSGATSAGTDLADRIAAAPVRVLGFLWCLGFASSLLTTIGGGTLTAPVYGFHSLGLLVSTVMIRERRSAAELANSTSCGTLIAVLTPMPHDRAER
jgi:hypothetical protein